MKVPNFIKGKSVAGYQKLDILGLKYPEDFLRFFLYNHRNVELSLNWFTV